MNFCCNLSSEIPPNGASEGASPFQDGLDLDMGSLTHWPLECRP